MGRIHLLRIAVIGVVLWVGLVAAEDDLLAMESDSNLGLSVLPAPQRLEDGSLAPEHRSQPSFPKYKVNRQFEEGPVANRPTLPPPRNPITPFATLGQQLGEYVRRMGDYLYWFVSGNPPVTLRRVNGKLRHPNQRGSPVRRKFVKGRTPPKNKKMAQRRRKQQQNKFFRRTQKIAYLPHRPIEMPKKEE